MHSHARGWAFYCCLHAVVANNMGLALSMSIMRNKDPHPSSHARGGVGVDLQNGHPSLQSNARGWACWSCIELSLSSVMKCTENNTYLAHHHWQRWVWWWLRKKKKCVNKTPNARPKIDNTGSNYQICHQTAKIIFKNIYYTTHKCPAGNRH